MVKQTKVEAKASEAELRAMVRKLANNMKASLDDGQRRVLAAEAEALLARGR